MTQTDLFGGEPQQTRLTLILEDERVTDGIPVTRLEVWSAAHTKRGDLLGIMFYRGSAHDLLNDDLAHLHDLWCWETIPGLKKWLKDRARYLRKYDRTHPYGTVLNSL